MNGPSPAPNPRRWLALALLGTAFFMVILDSTIVYVALPLIQDDLGFSTRSVQWVMSAYLLCFGGLLLLGGRTADLLGRRRVFMVGVALFGASSLICGLAWSEGALIAARVVQGAAAAIMAPTALSLLLSVFTEDADRNKALGIWGGLGGIGATAGLLIGGPVTEGLGWEWVFFINVPVALAVIALTPRLLPESVDEDCFRCFDLAGALTVTTAVLLLVAGISGATHAGWTHPRTLVFLGASIVLLALFRRIEQRSPGPLVPLRIFRSGSLVGGNLVLLSAGMCIEGMLFIVTLYAQEVLGYSTIQFGLMTAVMTVMSIIGAYSAQATVTKIGARPVGATGIFLIGVACLLLTKVSANGSYLGDIFLGLLIFGAGLGAAFVASQIAALSDVPEREAGLAAGLVDSSFNIGGALGLAILSTVAVARTDAAGGAGPVAMTEGFQDAFLVAVGFALLGFLAALTLLPRSTGEEAPTSAQPELASAELNGSDSQG
jgi:EmrB/QacA subfamily drug resistance transporter